MTIDYMKLRWLPDNLYLSLLYFYHFKKILHYKKPTTFNEKLQWLKIYYRVPIYTKLVDKVEAKQYVASMIGDNYVIPTLGVWDSFEEIDFGSLPNSFVIKCNHDSKSTKLVYDKEAINTEEFERYYTNRISKNAYYYGREWPYKNVKPKIMIEPLLKDDNLEDIKDYKFFCFNGTPKIMFVASNRNLDEELCFDFYDMDFQHLNIKNGHRNIDGSIDKPKNFEQMKILAAKLSKDIPHVRIDFYEVNGKVYFGEFTFFHNSGFVPFEPLEWDMTLGEWLELPNVCKV